jgi:phosphate-selective porin OprO/OprP
MERVMSLVQLPMQERTAVADALLPSRNVGAVLSGNAFDQRMSWAGGVFNDWIDTGSSISDSATQLIGRGTWVAFESPDESNLVHVGLGMRYSDGEEGARGATEPEFNKSPPFVDLGPTPIDTDDIFTYNLEASWRRGPYWLAAEYTNSKIDSPSFGSLTFDGYNVTGSWILTGEMREYRRSSGIFGPVPVAQSVYQGGWGAWEASVRFSNVNLNDGAFDGGDMDIASLGLNWWLSPVFNVNMNYRYIWNDRGGLSGRSSGLMARVLLVLE